MKLFTPTLLGIAGILPAIFCFVFFLYREPSSAIKSDLAASVFQTTIDPAALRQSYQESERKIKILIMPGHEPDFGGTEYKTFKEREWTVALGQDIANEFLDNDQYEVLVARGTSDWHPLLKEYFVREEANIEAYREEKRQALSGFLESGELKRNEENVVHNVASPTAALHLFGINKWANENNIDIILHIHFNDNARKKTSVPGTYSGFTIYAPERQYGNASASLAVAQNIHDRLSTLFAVSDLPKESDGVVEDQDLIAIGQGDSVKAAALLIEYGYIYESRFAEPELREKIFKELALQTYLGVEDFFAGEGTKSSPSTTLIDANWNPQNLKETSEDPNVLGLQALLTKKGFYPPAGETKNDCPLSGYYGECTVEAIKDFQSAIGLETTGAVGPKTLQAFESARDTLLLFQ